LGISPASELIQTPGIYPKDNILHQQHGESLKTKIYTASFNYGLFFAVICESEWK
jgi:hypothetical protein